LLNFEVFLMFVGDLGSAVSTTFYGSSDPFTAAISGTLGFFQKILKNFAGQPNLMQKL